MPPAPDKDAKIPCPSPQHLQAEFEELAPIFEKPESEESWDKLERALIRLGAVTRGGGYKHVAVFVEGVGRQGFGPAIVACMKSDRGRLSAAATDAVQVFGPRLGQSFAPLVPLYLDPLIRLSGRPNKVVLKRVDKVILLLISNCHLSSIVVELRKGLSDDAVTCRRGCAVAVVRAVNEWEKETWGEKGTRILEECLRSAISDKDAEVRGTGKTLWGLFTANWPERADDFSAPLSPNTRKRLDIKGDGPTKGKAPARNMGPPAHRPISAGPSSAAAAHAHAQTAGPLNPGHGRVKSTATVPTRSGDAASKKLPTISAPTSPNKLKEERPVLSKSTGMSNRTEGMGGPSRSASTYTLSSYARPASPERNDVWSKPHRPNLPSSYSTISLPAEQDQAGPVRRFPPPARMARPVLPPTAQSEDNFFSSAPGPSVFGGPVRLPPLSDRVPPRLGPAQRRVVTAPVTTMAPPPPPLKPTHPSHNDLAATLKGTRSVKKRVEELEEEIWTNSQPSSPVPLRPTETSSPNYFSAATVRGRKTSEPAASPLLPILMQSTNSTAGFTVDEEDLRAVHSLPEAENLSIMDNTLATTPLLEQQPPAELQPAKTEAAVSDNNLDQATQPSANDTIEGDVGPQETVAESLQNSETVQADQAEADHDEPTTTLHETAVHVPLPTSPDHQTVDLPAEEPTPSEQLVPEPAPYPKDPPHRARVISQTTGIRTKVSAPTVPAPVVKKAAVPRKPTVPPPAPVVRTRPNPPNAERKTFKPVTNAAKAAAKPAVPAATKGSSASVTTAPARPAGALSLGLGKAPAAPAVIARSASGMSATGSTARPAAPAPKPAVPRVVSKTIAKPETSHKLPAVKTTKPLNPPAPAPATASIGAPKTAKAHASVTIPPVRTDKIRRKAALPSFRPVRSKDRLPESAGLRGKVMGTLTASTTRSTVAKVKPESVPLPMSPAEKATMAPREIPLPRSPIASGSKPLNDVDSEKGDQVDHLPLVPDERHDELLPIPQVESDNYTPEPQVTVELPQEEQEEEEDEIEEEVEEVEEVEERGHGEDADDSGAEELEAEGLEEQPISIAIPVSPTTTMRGGGLKCSPSVASPISVSQPRAVSPVLTTVMPPRSPSPATTCEQDGSDPVRPADTYCSPLASTKLVDAPTPSDIPSPFLNANGQLYDADRFASNSTRYTSTRTVDARLSDAGSDENELDGLSTRLGRQRPLGAGPKKHSRADADTVESNNADLMEFSASTRPAHGERKDVSTPVKGVEVLLAKLASNVHGAKGVNGSPAIPRIPLRQRDANSSVIILGDEIMSDEEE